MVTHSDIEGEEGRWAVEVLRVSLGGAMTGVVAAGEHGGSWRLWWRWRLWLRLLLPDLSLGPRLASSTGDTEPSSSHHSTSGAGPGAAFRAW